MKTILCTNNYSELPKQILKDMVPKGFQLVFLDEQTEDNLIEKIKCADYLLVGGRLSITAKSLDNAPRLLMIQRSGVGLDALDLEVIKNKRIPLYVNMGINAESVAEYALLLILACLRRLTIIDNNTKSGIWKKQDQGILTHQLYGKTIGIIGMGSIARRLAELLKPFHVHIIYNDIVRANEEFESNNNMSYVNLEKLFSSSDIITIHCALTEQTRGMINDNTIRKMKNGVILINTARGPIINSVELSEHLKTGKIAFAGIDVHEKEPLTAAYPLKSLDNVILTPHIAGITHESFESMMKKAINNILEFDRGNMDIINSSRYL